MNNVVFCRVVVVRMLSISLCIQALVICLLVHDSQVMGQAAIKSISSNETIMSGGIQMIVNGDSLTGQVVLLGINLYMNNGSVSNETLSPANQGQCIGLNSTSMMCKTPTIRHPILTNNTLPADMTKLKFMTYFTVNGSPNSSTNSPVFVYLDPQFKTFSPSTTTFIANENRSIAIESVSELHGFTAADVAVQIGGVGVEKGGGQCSQVEVNLTHVTCRPPTMKPDDITFGTEATFTLTVAITVGGMAPQTVGKLEYTNDEPFSVIMIVMLAVLGFIIVVSVFCGLLTVCGCQCGETEANTSVHSDVSYEAVDVKPVRGQRATKSHGSNLSYESTVDDMSSGTFRSLDKEVGVDVGVDNRGYENWPGGAKSPPPVYETIGGEDAYRKKGGKMK